MKFKIKSKGKLSFKSNRKKIVTVNQKGKVTGKRYGTARITIKEKIKGRKSTSKKVTITVIPKTAKIKKIKSHKNYHDVYLKKSDKSITGYIVQISRSKSFPEPAGKRMIQKLSRNTFKKGHTKLGMPTKDKYYVKIHAYKKIGKKTYYGAWSNVKVAK